MRRILEQEDPADLELRTAARLLGHVPPIRHDAGRQRRVRLRIPSTAQRRPAQLWWAAAAVVLLLASVAGARGAAFTGFRGAVARIEAWTSRRAQGSTPAPSRAAPLETPVEPRPAAAAPTASPARVEAVAPAAPVGSSRPLVAAKPAPHVAASSQPSGVGAAAESASKTPSAAAALPDGPGADLVVAAMQARRAGDLARAEHLLSEYRSRFPGGALEEETLILSLEAAVQRRSERAPALARAYLLRFPHGQYRKWVEQTLQKPSP